MPRSSIPCEERTSLLLGLLLMVRRYPLLLLLLLWRGPLLLLQIICHILSKLQQRVSHIRTQHLAGVPLFRVIWRRRSTGSSLLRRSSNNRVRHWLLLRDRNRWRRLRVDGGVRSCSSGLLGLEMRRCYTKNGC